MPHSIQNIELLQAAVGTARSVSVLTFGAPDARPKFYIQAGLHADEVPGMLVAHHLIQRLMEADADGAIRGRIVVVPSANPIGLSQRLQAHHVGRSDMGLGGNFNRNYPDLGEDVVRRVRSRTEGGDALTTRLVHECLGAAVAAVPVSNEADSLRVALLKLAVDSDYVLDLHCDDEGILYAYISDLDHPAAMTLSREIGSEATLHGPGGAMTFKRACTHPWSRLGVAFPEADLSDRCLAATIEYRGMRDGTDELARDDADRLFRFMQRQGAISGDPGPLQDALSQPTPEAAITHLVAERAGLLVFRKKVGDTIDEGDIIADIIDPTISDPAQARTPVVARTSGRLFGHIASRIALPGSTVASIAGAEMADTPRNRDPYP